MGSSHRNVLGGRPKSADDGQITTAHPREEDPRRAETARGSQPRRLWGVRVRRAGPGPQALGPRPPGGPAAETWNAPGRAASGCPCDAPPAHAGRGAGRSPRRGARPLRAPRGLAIPAPAPRSPRLPPEASGQGPSSTDVPVPGGGPSRPPRGLRGPGEATERRGGEGPGRNARDGDLVLWSRGGHPLLPRAVRPLDPPAGIRRRATVRSDRAVDLCVEVREPVDRATPQARGVRLEQSYAEGDAAGH